MIEIARTPIESSSIASVGYSDVNATLEVEFRRDRGTVYRYFAVPRSVFRALLLSASKGAYFARFIRDRYPHAKI
jgi:hypothetical protein